jgi:hypothetical protein
MMFLQALKLTVLLRTGVVFTVARTSRYNLNSLTNITNEFKGKKVRTGGHVALMGNNECICDFICRTRDTKAYTVGGIYKYGP